MTFQHAMILLEFPLEEIYKTFLRSFIEFNHACTKRKSQRRQRCVKG